jgi:RNA polymerase sigma-70 factor (ECF subfamily)
VRTRWAAARGGDFDALVAALDPDVVLRADGGARPGASAVIRGADAVASQALTFAGPSRQLRPVLVNGTPGVLVTIDGQLVSVMGFTVTDGKILAIDALTDPGRLGQLDLAALDYQRR